MMLGGLEYLVSSQATPPSATEFHCFEGTTISEGTTPSLSGEVHHTGSISAGVPSGRAIWRGQDGGSLSIVYASRQPLHQSDVKVGQLVLDADDEVHVLRTLLTSRTKHLAKVLKKLYALVDESGEPVHREIFMSLQARLTRLLTKLVVNEPC